MAFVETEGGATPHRPLPSTQPLGPCPLSLPGAPQQPGLTFSRSPPHLRRRLSALLGACWPFGVIVWGCPWEPGPARLWVAFICSEPSLGQRWALGWHFHVFTISVVWGPSSCRVCRRHWRESFPCNPVLSGIRLVGLRGAVVGEFAPQEPAKAPCWKSPSVSFPESWLLSIMRKSGVEPVFCFLKNMYLFGQFLVAVWNLFIVAQVDSELWHVGSDGRSNLGSPHWEHSLATGPSGKSLG